VAVVALCRPEEVARGAGGGELGCTSCAVARGGCSCEEEVGMLVDLLIA